MSLGPALESAVVELLANGQQTSTQLHAQIVAAGAQVHHENVASAISHLLRAGKVCALGDGVYGLANAPAGSLAAQSTENEMSKKTCPRCKDQKPAAAFATSGYCHECARVYAREYAKKRASAKGEAKPVSKEKVAKPAPAKVGGVKVAQIITVDLDDAEGTTYSLKLRHDQACALAEALEEVVS